ncbi:MAG: glycosyltransferase [Deltaproteobacteria bacterium]|nr:glycosyltransferase [Deltaproteobacteria bacterium]
MNVLFIHQNFPGQYFHLAGYLARVGNHSVTGLGDVENIRKRGVLKGITTIGYPSPKGAGEATHPYLQGTEAAIRRGQAVARSLLQLKGQGYAPDVISVHPGWGEGLFVRDVYPDVPTLMFCEFYFHAGQADLGFDPEFPATPDWSYSIRIRNTAQVMSILTGNALVSPSRWQASRYPACFRNGMNIIHDGVNTGWMTPDPDEFLVLQPLRKAGESRLVAFTGTTLALETPAGGSGELLPEGDPVTLRRGDKVVLFVTRNLEPYRGYHVFMRSLPALQKRHPDAAIVIVGDAGLSYSPTLPEGHSYKDKYLDEVRGELDLGRVHFVGRLPYEGLRAAFRIASAHVYLTYPFVLSWSLLESMSCEGLIVASDTEPVREVIRHGENGLLVDFFDRDALVGTVDAVLREPGKTAALRKSARSFVEMHMPMEKCLRRQAELLEALARGKYPTPG